MPAFAANLDQLYPCSMQVSGNAADCKAFGLGDFINGCIKVDGVITNDSTDDIQDLMITVLVDKRVVTNLRASSLVGVVKPSNKGPFSGTAKFELTQALMLNAHLYLDRPDVECVLNPIH